MPASQLIISSLPTDRLPTTAILRCFGDGILDVQCPKFRDWNIFVRIEVPPLSEKW